MIKFQNTILRLDIFISSIVMLQNIKQVVSALDGLHEIETQPRLRCWDPGQ